MEAARSEDARDGRFEGLQEEARAAVGYGANTLRSVREQYREAYAETLNRWTRLRDELERIDRAPRDPRPRLVESEASAEDDRVRELRGEVELLGGDLTTWRGMLDKLDLAERTMARTWLFLSPGDDSLIRDEDASLADEDVAMRIIEAQEAERTRLAQEIHDGPAQALTNAIFQADYVERIGDIQPEAARAELQSLRDLLRRELGDVRDFIYQLRPAAVDELGLDGAIEDTVAHLRTVTELAITTELRAPSEGLDGHERTTVLRVTQEALQNVRKHAGATTVTVRTELADDAWTLEIHDNGRGFDAGAVTGGRRNFGLQFMRERAELIGATFDVRSSTDGTVVRLTIPSSAATGAKESR
jgi:two-component system sensor histidine kinase DegS